MLGRMITKHMIVTAYASVITYMVGKWGFLMAYMERGYAAVGGEYLFIPLAYCVAGSAMHYFISALEGLKRGKKDCNEKRSRGAARM